MDIGKMGESEHASFNKVAPTSLPPGDGDAVGSVPSFMREGLWARLLGRLFHAFFLLRRPMTLGARAVVYDKRENSVFLIRHTYVPGWQLPGGGVEAGETMVTALQRELSEEGNIELLGAPVLKSIHFNRQASRRDHVGLYLVTEFRQAFPKKPDIEIAEAGFFPLDALPHETSPATRRRLDEIFTGTPASEYW